MTVAAISYDTPEILQHFADRVGLSIPLLSDPDSVMIRAFGIFNTNIPPDNYRYGVPFPGTYVVDEKGVVLEKYFEKHLGERTTAHTILAKEFGEGNGKRIRVETPHLAVTFFASQDVVRRGNRITLVLDVELQEKIHIYGPVEKPYIPTSFSLDDSASWVAHGTELPEPTIMDMPAIKERIPVYEGRIRITKDVTLSLDLPETGETELKGEFTFQACDEKICYPPATLPLTFTLQLVPHDRERAPEDMRKSKG